ncbi:MAG: hypothetical protein M1831_001726 [Alyxoria varia]|nr:MAG: hypothetical protein M1831_001726 [Alyxoria varia]
MTAQMSTILLIGGTSGLGEHFAHALHAQDKKPDRLSQLSTELPGLQTHQSDISDIPNISAHASQLLAQFPDIDTVWVNAGIQKSFLFSDPSTSTDADIAKEVETNVTAPAVLIRAFWPHLAKVAESGRYSHLLMTGSGLGFMPMAYYPVYAPTKSAVHSLCITARQQLSFASEKVKRYMSVALVAPPYLDDTGLDAGHRKSVRELQGGEEKAVKPMRMGEYMDVTMRDLAVRGEDGKMLKDIGTGFAAMGARIFREGFGEQYKKMGVDC